MKVALLAVVFAVVPAVADITVPDGFSSENWFAAGTLNIRGLAVGPGGDWGTQVYLANAQNNTIIRLTAPNTPDVVSSGLNIPEDSIYSLSFDPSGEFGNDLYVSSVRPGNFGTNDVVYRVDSFGTNSIFHNAHPFMGAGMAFGRGNGFGTTLFMIDPKNSNLRRIESSGGSSQFGSGLLIQVAEDDIVITDDAAFGNYAFVTDGSTDDGGTGLYRMSPSGVVDRFVSDIDGSALAQGSGLFGSDLYMGDDAGQIWRIDSSGNPTMFASGFGNSVWSIAFGVNEMWVLDKAGDVHRIIPTPASILPLLVGLGFGLKRRR